MHEDDRSELENLLAGDPGLRHLARRLAGDETTADDLLQQAWLSGAREPNARIRDVGAWLRGVIRNLARMHRRSERQRAQREKRVARSEHVGSQAQLEDVEHILQSLRACLAELAEPYQTVVRMRYLEELSTADIATRLARKESTILSQLKRGLDDLRDRLDRRSSGNRAAWIAVLRRIGEDTDAPVREVGELTAVAGGGVLLWRWLAAAAVLFVAVGFTAYEWTRADGVESGRDPVIADLGRTPRTQDLAQVEIATAGNADRLSVASTARAPTSDPSSAATDATAPSMSSPALDVSVVDGAGIPVPNATVVLRRDSGLPETRVRSDARGRVRVPIAEQDSQCVEGTPHVSLTAFAEGWATLHNCLVPCPDRGTKAVTIDVGGPEMRVSGRVVDDGGRAIAGARVEIDSDLAVPTLRADGTTTTPIGYQAASREDGSFEVAFIPPARRRMIVRATGYLPHDQWIESSDRDTPRRIVMRAGVSIDGRLTNSDGTPAAGARVFAEKVPASISDPVHADENGLYRLEGIASGPTRLWAVDESGADTVATTVIDLQVGVEGRWDATLEPRAGWRLRIVDRAGKPIACCRVSFHVPVFAAGTHPEEHHSALEAFYGWNRWGITDAEGRVVVRDGPEKPLDIQVFLPRAGSTFPTAELNAVPSSLDERVVTLDSDDRALATLTGSVRDAEGRPLAQGSLYLINQETESARIIALDAADGRFNITGIPPSTYRIQATAPKQGWADLGSHTLSAGAVVDLGALTTPTLARLQVDWRWDEVKEPGPYTFALAMQWKGASDTYVAMSVDAGAEPGTGEYALFPGLYSLHVFRGGVARQFRVFALPPFEHLDVESGEDELFLLPLHIEQARPAGVALSVTVRVSELEHPETTVLEETFNLPAEGILDAHVRLAAGAYLVEARSGSELRGSAKVELGSEQLIRRLPIRLE